MLQKKALTQSPLLYKQGESSDPITNFMDYMSGCPAGHVDMDNLGGVGMPDNWICPCPTSSTPGCPDTEPCPGGQAGNVRTYP